MKTCCFCKYWWNYDDDNLEDHLGRCHLNPPSTGIDGEYPITGDADTCSHLILNNTTIIHQAIQEMSIFDINDLEMIIEYAQERLEILKKAEYEREKRLREENNVKNYS